jgi:uncharacterized protein YyaL (SSP411 family)
MFLALITAVLACGQEEPKMENRLAKEKSPYLLQHKDNPVDWYPWGEEAFEKAKKEDKPIFLSIGYSTCHWCHVMERESFENEATAKIMNENFVSIKVDREERPDVDQVYMTACQVMTGRGGWPLSIWMTPDRKPFFTGTYFPPEDRWGQRGFPEILKAIAVAWKEKRELLLKDADKLVEAIRKAGGAVPGEMTKETLVTAIGRFRDSFDATWGGFGDKPKFPRSINHEFLLRSVHRTGDKKTLEMVEKTLQAMRAGGMYDQLGDGFHRYSTDERWLVPHFEKMLYDNALLARAYTQAYQVTGKEEYADTVRRTLDYVLRVMTSEEGGFYSAEDADSDLPDGGHAEGAFYVFTPEQVLAIVPGEEGKILCRALGVVEGGNYTPVEKEEPRGNSVLHVAVDTATLAKEFEKSAEEIDRILLAGRAKLFEVREKRPRPGLDDKILTDWNGLMIGAMAFSGSVLGEQKYVDAAEKAAGFLVKTMRQKDGRWLHRYRAGDAAIPAFLDDYAFLAEGFFLLHQATFKTEVLEVAVRTAEIMIEDFGDPDGAFFHTAKTTKLIARMKESYDGALPSGNSVATLTLVRLGDLCTREDFLKKAEGTLKYFGGTISRYEPGFPYHLCALDALLGPRQEIVLVGESKEMLSKIRRTFLPNTVVALVPAGGPDERMKKLIPMTADRPQVEGKPTAYVCENYTCQMPTNSVETFGKQLAGE